MFERLLQSLRDWPAYRWGIVGLVTAAIGITMAVSLSNRPEQRELACAANPAARAALTAVAVGEMAALTPTASGRGYADLAFTDDTGRPLTLTDFAGRPLLVNLWATWCGPCRAEMPELDALAGRYSDEVFSVVPVNVDLGADGVVLAQTFLDEGGFANLPLYADPSFGAFERLKSEGVALGLPVTLLLDAEGCELAVLQGPAAWNSADAHTVVEALVALDNQ